jgi:uncharacterized repeat protein (TIGR03803 family)
VGDGAGPEGDLIFDESGNIYGTAINGGNLNSGVVYELTRAGGGWTGTVLYAPGSNANPYGGVVFDNVGNLYGATYQGGFGGAGTVYQLSPSGSGWTGRTLVQFYGADGATPIGGLIIDPSGNLYGTTSSGGDRYGTVFELTPADGGWTFNTLYRFLLGAANGGPQAKLVMDAAGNLYGTTYADGAYGYGSVFKLTPGSAGWTQTVLHDFTGAADGAFPVSNLVFDASGNLYGTTWFGGSPTCSQGCGVVFEIVP